AGRAVRAASPRPPGHDALDARLAGSAGRAVEGPARGPGAGAGANRSAPGERWQGRCAVDQPGTRTTQRAASAADGEPRRPWPRAHAWSTVMHAIQLVLSAVMAIQPSSTPATRPHGLS